MGIQDQRGMKWQYLDREDSLNEVRSRVVSYEDHRTDGDSFAKKHRIPI